MIDRREVLFGLGGVAVLRPFELPSAEHVEGGATLWIVALGGNACTPQGLQKTRECREHLQRDGFEAVDEFHTTTEGSKMLVRREFSTVGEAQAVQQQILADCEAPEAEFPLLSAVYLET